MNISHLVEKIKKGDNKSFEKLYELTEREVWFTCISFLKNETTAQDIMQETYITAFLKSNLWKSHHKSEVGLTELPLISAKII